MFRPFRPSAWFKVRAQTARVTRVGQTQRRSSSAAVAAVAEEVTTGVEDPVERTIIVPRSLTNNFIVATSTFSLCKVCGKPSPERCDPRDPDCFYRWHMLWLHIITKVQ